MKISFLKLGPGFLVLWVVLLVIVTSKIYLIRATTAADFLKIVVFGMVMLSVSYAGAWIVWSFSGKDQRTGEFTYLGIMTVFFLARTVMLYREAMATV